MVCCTFIIFLIALLLFPLRKILSNQNPLDWQLSMTEEPIKKKTFSFSARIKSFHYAFNGMKLVLKHEHNTWIHLIAASIVIFASFYFQIKPYEWLAVIFTITLVFLAETINTCIEHLCNFISPEHHEMIGKIKDIAAGAVLITAISSILIGLFIFTPYITGKNDPYSILSSICTSNSAE